MKNFAFERVGSILVGVNNRQSPRADEWALYVQACRDLDRELNGDFSRAAALIFTDGGGPNSDQRRAMVEVLNGRPAATAIVTGSTLLRGSLAILGVFNPAIKVFAPTDWRAGATLAKIPEAQHMDFLRRALKLAREVGELEVLRSIGL